MIRHILVLLVSLLMSAAAHAQSPGTRADHEALRKLKGDATEAVNRRDYSAMRKLLRHPFMATVVTQDNFTDFDKLEAYFENLYTRDFLRMKSVSVAAEADDLSQIFEGPFAVTKGSTKERYELADGRTFDMDGRWTAVSLKENGEWKLLAIHTGANFLDNPVIAAIEKSVVWTGLGGAAVGLLAGFAAGWFAKRQRA